MTFKTSKGSLWKVTALCAALTLCMTGAAFAEEATQAPEEATTAAQEIKAPEQEAGQKDLSIEVTNNTGSDIAFIGVYEGTFSETDQIIAMQEALIAQGFLDDVADGAFGPLTKAAVADFREKNGMDLEGGADDEMLAKLLGDAYTKNLISGDKMFANGEKMALTLKKSDAKDEAKEANDLTDIVSGFGYNTDYSVMFKLADDDTAYVIHAFDFDGMKNPELCMENGIAYVLYEKDGSADKVSTYDAEAAIYDFEHPVVEANYDSYDDYGSYDYYDDYSYDYSYDDYGYTDDVYGVDGCFDPADAIFN